jgi:hypothetical protein
VASAKKTMELEIDFSKLQRLLTIGGPRAAKAVGQALYKEAAQVFENSQLEVPVDTGNLRNSGQLGLPFTENGQMVVEISYGGAAADYAIYVHEDLEARHQPGKKAKFLEGPLKRQTKGMSTRLTRSVEKGLGL